jgi:ATP-dependent Clp protease ATP-binding subunit ClpA
MDNIKQIARLMVNDVVTRVRQQAEIVLTVDEKVYDMLCTEGFDNISRTRARASKNG